MCNKNTVKLIKMQTEKHIEVISPYHCYACSKHTGRTHSYFTNSGRICVTCTDVTVIVICMYVLLYTVLQRIHCQLSDVEVT